MRVFVETNLAGTGGLPIMLPISPTTTLEGTLATAITHAKAYLNKALPSVATDNIQVAKCAVAVSFDKDTASVPQSYVIVATDLWANCRISELMDPLSTGQTAPMVYLRVAFTGLHSDAVLAYDLQLASNGSPVEQNNQQPRPASHQQDQQPYAGSGNLNAAQPPAVLANGHAPRDPRVSLSKRHKAEHIPGVSNPRPDAPAAGQPPEPVLSLPAPAVHNLPVAVAEGTSTKHVVEDLPEAPKNSSQADVFAGTARVLQFHSEQASGLGRAARSHKAASNAAPSVDDATRAMPASRLGTSANGAVSEPKAGTARLHEQHSSLSQRAHSQAGMSSLDKAARSAGRAAGKHSQSEAALNEDAHAQPLDAQRRGLLATQAGDARESAGSQLGLAAGNTVVANGQAAVEQVVHAASKGEKRARSEGSERQSGSSGSEGEPGNQLALPPKSILRVHHNALDKQQRPQGSELQSQGAPTASKRKLRKLGHESEQQVVPKVSAPPAAAASGPSQAGTQAAAASGQVAAAPGGPSQQEEGAEWQGTDGQTASMDAAWEDAGRLTMELSRPHGPSGLGRGQLTATQDVHAPTHTSLSNQPPSAAAAAATEDGQQQEAPAPGILTTPKMVSRLSKVHAKLLHLWDALGDSADEPVKLTELPRTAPGDTANAKIRITCEGTPGVYTLSTQLVTCYCPTCTTYAFNRLAASDKFQSVAPSKLLKALVKEHPQPEKGAAGKDRPASPLASLLAWLPQGSCKQWACHNGSLQSSWSQSFKVPGVVVKGDKPASIVDVLRYLGVKLPRGQGLKWTQGMGFATSETALDTQKFIPTTSNILRQAIGSAKQAKSVSQGPAATLHTGAGATQLTGSPGGSTQKAGTANVGKAGTGAPAAGQMTTSKAAADKQMTPSEAESPAAVGSDAGAHRAAQAQGVPGQQQAVASPLGDGWIERKRPGALAGSPAAGTVPTAAKQQGQAGSSQSQDELAATQQQTQTQALLATLPDDVDLSKMTKAERKAWKREQKQRLKQEKVAQASGGDDDATLVGLSAPEPASTAPQSTGLPAGTEVKLSKRAKKALARQQREAARQQAEAEEAARQQAEAEEAARQQAEAAEAAREQAEAAEAARQRAEAEEAARQQAEAAEAARQRAEAEEAARQQAEAPAQVEAVPKQLSKEEKRRLKKRKHEEAQDKPGLSDSPDTPPPANKKHKQSVGQPQDEDEGAGRSDTDKANDTSSDSKQSTSSSSSRSHSSTSSGKSGSESGSGSETSSRSGKQASSGSSSGDSGSTSSGSSSSSSDDSSSSDSASGNESDSKSGGSSKHGSQAKSKAGVPQGSEGKASTDAGSDSSSDSDGSSASASGDEGSSEEEEQRHGHQAPSQTLETYLAEWKQQGVNALAQLCHPKTIDGSQEGDKQEEQELEASGDAAVKVVPGSDQPSLFAASQVVPKAGAKTRKQLSQPEQAEGLDKYGVMTLQLDATLPKALAAMRKLLTSHLREYISVTRVRRHKAPLASMMRFNQDDKPEWWPAHIDYSSAGINSCDRLATEMLYIKLRTAVTNVRKQIAEEEGLAVAD